MTTPYEGRIRPAPATEHAAGSPIQTNVDAASATPKVLRIPALIDIQSPVDRVVRSTPGEVSQQSLPAIPVTDARSVHIQIMPAVIDNTVKGAVQPTPEMENQESTQSQPVIVPRYPVKEQQPKVFPLEDRTLQVSSLSVGQEPQADSVHQKSRISPDDAPVVAGLAVQVIYPQAQGEVFIGQTSIDEITTKGTTIVDQHELVVDEDAEESLTALFESKFVPNPTRAIIKTVQQVEGSLPDAQQVYFVETSEGVDAVIVSVNRENEDDRTRHTTEWEGRGFYGYPIDPAFYVRGIFEEKRRYWVDRNGNLFRINIYTNPDKVNYVMTAVGKNPGKDAFKMSTTDDAKFSDRASVEAAAKLEALIATKDEYYIYHDRTLSDHVNFWIFTPTEIALILQQRANDRLKQGDEQISEFASGLDSMAELSRILVPKISNLVDGLWEDTDTVDSQVQKAIRYIGTYTQFIGEDSSRFRDQNWLDAVSVNDVVSALIQTGFIDKGLIDIENKINIKWPGVTQRKNMEGSAEIQNAREIFTELAIAYTRNIADILLLVDNLQGVPPGVDHAKRKEFVEKLHTSLTPAAVAAYGEHLSRLLSY